VSPTELLRQCEEQVARCGPEAEIVLFLRGRTSRGRGVRLLGRGGPTGRRYSDQGGGLTVGFKAAQIRDYLAARMGGVKG
jgi:hypothetical protein